MACEMVIGSEDNSVTWSINNFSYCWQKTGEALSGPTFYIKEHAEIKWKLLLYPRGVFNDKYLTLCLRREWQRKVVQNAEIKYCFEYLDNDGSFLNFGEGKYEHSQGFVRDGILRNVMKYLPQDILTLRCRVKFAEKAPEIRQLFFRTIINVETISFSWSIGEFSCLVPDEIKTFVISSTSKEVMIEIKLFQTEEKYSDANIFMNVCPIDRCMKYLTAETFILSSENNKTSSGVFKCWFENGKGSTFPLKFTKSDLINSKNHYLPNDVLTLNVELNISTRLAFEGAEKVVSVYTSPTSNEVTQTLQNYEAPEKTPESPCTLTFDLMSLYEDQSLCDMKLKTKTNTFPVHTSILGARSPVFKAMFSCEMKEKVCGCVDASDLDDETVRRLLLYFYTDKLEDLSCNVALQLFKAADKYSVISLKEKCSLFLKNHLQLENACEVLILSDLHQDEDLKIIAQNFILKNATEILKSEEWRLLVYTYSNLAIETMSRNWLEDS